MKVLHITSSDSHGGADKAAMRLHQTLRNTGIDSQVLVQFKHSSNSNFLSPYVGNRKPIAKYREYTARLQVYSKINTKELFTTARLSSPSMRRIIRSANPDIIHIHWIGKGLLSLQDILSLNKPVVWSLHDMWAFTGGCHYDDGCGQSQTGCGNCPLLKSPHKKDLSFRHFQRKKSFFDRLGLNYRIIGLSKWLYQESLTSSMFISKQVFHLPNTIDTQAFKPLDKKTSRRQLGLPLASNIILFGSMGVNSSKRKGFLQLKETMKFLDTENNTLCVFGSSEEPKINTNHECISLGHIDDENTLQAMYSAADVLVSPSLQENLSNIIMESMACNTPVVAFDIGGNPDLIDHKTNGYLAKPYDSEDLAAGIQWILNSKSITGTNPRESVLEKYAEAVVTPKYIDLYSQLL